MSFWTLLPFQRNVKAKHLGEGPMILRVENPEGLQYIGTVLNSLQHLKLVQSYSWRIASKLALRGDKTWTVLGTNAKCP